MFISEFQFSTWRTRKRSEINISLNGTTFIVILGSKKKSELPGSIKKLIIVVFGHNLLININYLLVKVL